MTVTIDDFDGVDWDLDSIGLEVLEGSTISRIDRELLAGGRPSSVVGGMRIRWLRGEKTMHSAFMNRLQSRGGHAFSDLERLAEGPCQAIREAERRISEWVTDVFGGRPAQFSYEDGPKSRAQHAAMLRTYVPEGAWEAYKIHKHGVAAAEEAKAVSLQAGRILVVAGTRAGWELISPDNWITGPIEFSSENEWRFVFSGDLPRDLTRDAGQGPRSRQQLSLEEKAAHWLSSSLGPLSSGPPGPTKADAFKAIDEQFPGFSNRAKERIWSEVATPQMKQGGRRPTRAEG